MKLGVSTDFGSPAHWARVVEFARRNDVTRVVFWGDYSTMGMAPPLLYPSCPALVPDEQRGDYQRLQERMQHAAQLATAAGLEFWYVLQVLQLPDIALAKHLRPDLFNADGEPAMERDAIYHFIRTQIEELFSLVPSLHGIELWVMECAAVRMSHLKHQLLPLPAIFTRIVDTIYDAVMTRGRRLAVDLHTAGGDPIAREALLAAAQRHPQVLVSGDNVQGDFSLHLPFNPALERAAATNPIQVHFDLNGEYWGRNFVPTAAFDQYSAHLERARALGAEYVDARLSTGHDRWSAYAHVLPSRRQYYPMLAEVNAHSALPPAIEMTVTDTLGTMNAEFFCRHAHDPSVDADRVIAEVLQREFGEEATALTPVFRALQSTLGKLFYTDHNYFGAQSVLPANDWLLHFFAFDAQVAALPGREFPPAEIRAECDGEQRAAYPGWPLPLGHRCAGVEAMVREKVEAVSEAEAMLAIVKATPLVAPGQTFLIHQFETLVLYARTYRALFESLAHASLLTRGIQRGSLPDLTHLHACLQELTLLANEWRTRFHPTWFNDPAGVLERWCEQIRSSLSAPARGEE